MSDEREYAGLRTADPTTADEEWSKDRVEETKGQQVWAQSPASSAREDDRGSPKQATPLFSSDETRAFQSRWDVVQTGFVDEPRRALEQADDLVAEVIKRLTAKFASERTSLEQQWDRGDSISTEDLRLALQRYRSFFGRLLTV